MMNLDPVCIQSASLQMHIYIYSFQQQENVATNKLHMHYFL